MGRGDIPIVIPYVYNQLNSDHWVPVIFSRNGFPCKIRVSVVYLFL